MINTAGARLVDKSPEEVIGLDDTQLFSVETAARIMERDRSLLDSGVTRTDEDTSATPSGVLRTYLTTKGPLRDSSGAVLTEALAYHLPILTLNHQGVGVIVPPNAAIKVPVTNPEETVSVLADIADPVTREEYGKDPRHVTKKVSEYVKAGCTCPVLYPLGADVERMIAEFKDWSP